jgi:hypothetical protein
VFGSKIGNVNAALKHSMVEFGQCHQQQKIPRQESGTAGENGVER